MGEETSMVATYSFRGAEFTVTMNVTGGDQLAVEVQDKLTADQWAGTFSSSYLEDLTHKTGNYKSFPIFVNMLESALTQTCDSVTLDLLTYTDLETLRGKKGFAGTKPLPASHVGVLTTKRYLILTYTVEFDRIHYPLPLPYVGKPDPAVLQETIRRLNEQINRLTTQGNQDHKGSEFRKLRKAYSTLLKEKEQIEQDFLQFRRDVDSTAKGNPAKEIRVLKQVVKNLEQELLKERSRHQRSANKKSQAYKELQEELEELRATERNLRVRVKSLTNELAVYKRGPRERSTSRDRFRDRSLSRDRSGPAPNSRSRDRLRDRPLSRERSLSRDRSGPGLRSRSSSRERTYRSYSDIKTPSPIGSKPRFDPTAYVKRQNLKKQQSAEKRKRETRSMVRTGGTPAERGRTRSRQRPPMRERNRSSSVGSTGSVGRNRTRRSSAGSISDVGVLSDNDEPSRSRLKGVLKKRKPPSSSYLWTTPEGPDSRKRLSSTPATTSARRKRSAGVQKVSSGGYHDRSAEMAEIDARLSALQQYMQSSLATQDY
ncbi:coiled-coil domain-containing protein 61-like [Branchiostoma floridae]|uniref:Centrosomal protein CCDC61 n=1 Tax=Branchiostoma floridae TaxID=7739 RepID=A0A9J7KSE7_BRAFL|nr:coiled-coil domain-containing protein 61-like [Branchiostoma floridae]XP_035669644.1 coiled-coil domain-containing protein 61-like [Branchiostoma floridae]